jgi:hypothetical protein
MWDNEAGDFGLGIVGQRRVPVKVCGVNVRDAWKRLTMYDRRIDGYIRICAKMLR